MTEPGFQDLRSGPNSVIFTAESNFKNCLVRTSYKFEIFDPKQRLAALELSEVLQSGPDPVSNKSILVQKNRIITLRSQEKSKDGSESVPTEDESIAIDSARNSFSQALKECQDRRLGSGVIERPSAATCGIATSPGPGTPNHQHMNAMIQKGRNSDRVLVQSDANRRKVNTALLLPYNNGKALPSKWEDAERWICSPASGDGAVRRTYQQPQRQPKSNSGPLGHPGTSYYQLFSPAGGGNKLSVNSPCSSSADGLSTQYEGCERSGNFVMRTEPCMARSISIHGYSETLGHQSSSQVHQDEKHDGAEDVSDNASGAVSRRDMPTQISPRRHPSFSLTAPSIQPIVEMQTMQSTKPEIRDVQVDERVTMTRWSKKNGSKYSGSGSRKDVNWKMKGTDVHTAGWEVPTETSKSISEIKKEEAKISVWENLQRTKAETAIRKLEMQLEKKRLSSMEKIMNKLRSAQRKAQEKRGSMVTTKQAVHQTARPSLTALTFRKTGQFGCCMCNTF